MRAEARSDALFLDALLRRLSLAERQEVVLGLLEREQDPELLIGLRSGELQALSENDRESIEKTLLLPTEELRMKNAEVRE